MEYRRVNSGAYAEGVEVFKMSQELYLALNARSLKGLRSAAAGYGVAQQPLVELALRCCSLGKYCSCSS